jgi:hypothetical protein
MAVADVRARLAAFDALRLHAPQTPPLQDVMMMSPPQGTVRTTDTAPTRSAAALLNAPQLDTSAARVAQGDDMFGAWRGAATPMRQHARRRGGAKTSAPPWLSFGPHVRHLTDVERVRVPRRP